jgi:uncharacterized membrane protein YhaH (DUF805 family)
MSLSAAVSTCMSKYATLSGRATRAEYWYFYLFLILAFLAVVVVSSVLPDAMGAVLLIAAYIGLGIPAFAVTVRRLHDTGKSGWWQLITITGIGTFVLLYWLVSSGDRSPNQYGDAATAA